MIYIPPDKKLSIVPDFSNLPVTIAWPRNRSAAKKVLVASGVWMIFAAGIAVVIFVLFPQLSYLQVLMIIGIVTLFAFLAGLSALRQYASQDETTVGQKGVTVLCYHWASTSKQLFTWSDLNSITCTDLENDYSALKLEFTGGKIVPVALSKNKGAIRQAQQRLNEYVKRL